MTLDDSLAVVRYESTVKIADMIKAVDEEGYGATVLSGPVDVKAGEWAPSKKVGAAVKAAARPRSLLALHRSLTREPYVGADPRLQIEMTLVTQPYLEALFAADRKAGKTTESFPAYKKIYSSPETISIIVRIATPASDTTRLDLRKAALLIDEKGNKVSAAGWRDLPAPTSSKGVKVRRGLLSFPRLSKMASATGPRPFEVVLKGIGSVREARFKWDFSTTGGKR